MKIEIVDLHLIVDYEGRKPTEAENEYIRYLMREIASWDKKRKLDLFRSSCENKKQDEN